MLVYKKGRIEYQKNNQSCKKQSVYKFSPFHFTGQKYVFPGQKNMRFFLNKAINVYLERIKIKRPYKDIYELIY